MAISRGAIPSGGDIKVIRAQAIDGLFSIFDATDTTGDQLSIVTSLWQTTQLPHQANYSNDLLATALADMKAIAQRLRSRLAAMSFELREHIESHIFREFERFRPIAETENDTTGCKTIARALIDEITALRKKMNRNRDFVRYKTLIGFEGVSSQQWKGDALGYTEVQAQRKARAAKYVELINPRTGGYWLNLIARCAATKSNDMATFPIFCAFLQMLGERRPEIALRLLDTDDEDVLKFLPAILSGLATSDAKKEYSATVERYVEAKQHLSAVAGHYRFVDSRTVEAVAKVLAAAIEADDAAAAIKCLVFAVSKWPILGDEVIGALFLPALDYLTPKKNFHWVRNTWYLNEARDFFAHLSAEQLGKVSTILSTPSRLIMSASTFLL